MTPLLNSAGKPLYVLRRISDKVVTNPRAVSNTLGAPNPGPDQEYLAILTDAAPDNDPVFTIRTQIEGPNEATVPPQWEIHYKVEDRPKDQQKAAVDNAERFEVAKYVSSNNFQRDTVLLLSALLRAQRGLVLTPEETAANDKVVAIAAVLTQNQSIAGDKKAAIDAGQKPDLSTWVTAADAAAVGVVAAFVTP